MQSNNDEYLSEVLDDGTRVIRHFGQVIII